MVEKISPQEMVQKRMALAWFRDSSDDERNGRGIFNFDLEGEKKIREEIAKLEEFLRDQIEEHWDGNPAKINQELQDVGDTFHTPFRSLDDWP